MTAPDELIVTRALAAIGALRARVEALYLFASTASEPGCSKALKRIQEAHVGVNRLADEDDKAALHVIAEVTSDEGLGVGCYARLNDAYCCSRIKGHVGPHRSASGEVQW
jgi:hypothetical protein